MEDLFFVSAVALLNIPSYPIMCSVTGITGVALSIGACFSYFTNIIHDITVI